MGDAPPTFTVSWYRYKDAWVLDITIESVASERISVDYRKRGAEIKVDDD